jgi:hypothetical protein
MKISATRGSKICFGRLVLPSNLLGQVEKHEGKNKKTSCNPRDNLITSKGAEKWFFSSAMNKASPTRVQKQDHSLLSKTPENGAL